MASAWTTFDHACMCRALELAARGEGTVEPNPMVGCVIARNESVIAEGWHHACGEPHAEINALRQLPEGDAHDCRLYVTLEPCCHHGRTPPCVDAILRAGIRDVVVALVDPYPEVAGKGIERLRAEGVHVEIGLESEAAAALNAPFATRITQRRPWVHAKWAMSLDGRIATHSGHSQWISGEDARRIVHQLRGRMDAILVGRGTALADDPQLTARPPGSRVATRIVLDSKATLPETLQLFQTADNFPTLVAVAPSADLRATDRLGELGCEVLICEGEDRAERLDFLLRKLAARDMTHLLVEGGSEVLGSFHDGGWIDEAHLFVAPKLIGGAQAYSPIEGVGVRKVPQQPSLTATRVRTVGNDVYIHGRVARQPSPAH